MTKRDCEFTDPELEKLVFWAVFADGHFLGDIEDDIKMFATKDAAVDYIKNHITPEAQITYTVAKYSVCNDDARDKANYSWKSMQVLVPSEMCTDDDVTAPELTSWEL